MCIHGLNTLPYKLGVADSLLRRLPATFSLGGAYAYAYVHVICMACMFWLMSFYMFESVVVFWGPAPKLRHTRTCVCVCACNYSLFRHAYVNNMQTYLSIHTNAYTP